MWFEIEYKGTLCSSLYSYRAKFNLEPLTAIGNSPSEVAGTYEKAFYTCDHCVYVDSSHGSYENPHDSNICTKRWESEKHCNHIVKRHEKKKLCDTCGEYDLIYMYHCLICHKNMCVKHKSSSIEIGFYDVMTDDLVRKQTQ